MGGRLILASASPRRRALLGEAGHDFTVEPADVDETIDDATPPVEAARELAARKAREIAGRHAGEDAWVVGSDTVVAIAVEGGTRLLGKPSGPEEAREFLEALSGTRHQVVTGVAVAAVQTGELRVDAERTWVSMRVIRDEEVAAYVASGEWEGKAGGYAIQENADAFVTGLEEGGFDNVVGLPVRLTERLLAEAGYPDARPGP